MNYVSAWSARPDLEFMSCPQHADVPGVVHHSGVILFQEVPGVHYTHCKHDCLELSTPLVACRACVLLQLKQRLLFSARGVGCGSSCYFICCSHYLAHIPSISTVATVSVCAVLQSQVPLGITWLPKQAAVGSLPLSDLKQMWLHLELLFPERDRHCKTRAVLGLQVHDQRSAMTEEEECANQVWLDGRAPPQEGSGLESQARHMIQGQRQYYDEVHVIKEQVHFCTSLPYMGPGGQQPYSVLLASLHCAV